MWSNASTIESSKKTLHRSLHFVVGERETATEKAGGEGRGGFKQGGAGPEGED